MVRIRDGPQLREWGLNMSESTDKVTSLTPAEDTKLRYKVREVFEATCNAIETFTGLEGYNGESRNLQIDVLAVMLTRVNLWAAGNRACNAGVDAVAGALLDIVLSDAREGASYTRSKQHAQDAVKAIAESVLKQITEDNGISWDELREYQQEFE
jgi:hypothetical protein